MLSRIIYGARVSLGIGVVVVAISLVIGCAWGVVVGWVGGRLDQASNFIIDVFLAFPGFLFAVAIAAETAAELSASAAFAMRER